eukprot:1782936-Alexandrium_andersonii.AAC.1
MKAVRAAAAFLGLVLAAGCGVSSVLEMAAPVGCLRTGCVRGLPTAGAVPLGCSPVHHPPSPSPSVATQTLMRSFA